MENCTARLMTRTHKREHIKQVLLQLLASNTFYITVQVLFTFDDTKRIQSNVGIEIFPNMSSQIILNLPQLKKYIVRFLIPTYLKYINHCFLYEIYFCYLSLEHYYYYYYYYLSVCAIMCLWLI